MLGTAGGAAVVEPAGVPEAGAEVRGDGPPVAAVYGEVQGRRLGMFLLQQVSDLGYGRESEAATLVSV